MLLGIFTVYDLCPYIRIKLTQITPSATRKSPPGWHAASSSAPAGRLAPSPRSPASRAEQSGAERSGATAPPFPRNRLAKQGLSRHAALTLTGAAPGREGADIPALPVKSAFQRLCLGVGKNKEGLSVHMQNPTLFCPNCQAVAQDLNACPRLPLPTKLIPVSLSDTSSVSLPSYLSSYIHVLKYTFSKN